VNAVRGRAAHATVRVTVGDLATVLGVPLTVLIRDTRVSGVLMVAEGED
jgi:hypothetical protein